MRISAVETRRYVYPLDPPFHAAWDPGPARASGGDRRARAHRRGRHGLSSGGDGLSDRELLERLLVGRDPLRTECIREIGETVDFHGGRPWTVEIAVWDLVGKIVGQPLWKLLGGRSERLVAYASSGELLEPAERAERCVALAERGVRQSSSGSTTPTGATTSP